MSPTENEVSQVAAMVVQAVLEMPCAPTDELCGLSPNTMAAVVQITGGWQGAVVLGCSAPFAAQAAAIMFQTPADALTPRDLQDAIAELTNMIGGNFKGLLPTADACQLSLPTVVVGADYSTRVPGSRPMHRVALDCGGMTIVINVLEKLPAAHAA